MRSNFKVRRHLLSQFFSGRWRSTNGTLQFIFVQYIGTFLRDVKPILTTTNITGKADNSAIRVGGLKDVNTETRFYVVQHDVTDSTNLDKYVSYRAV
jgi:hypothetical protein